MPEQTPSNNVLELTAQIVSAHVSNNSVTPDALPSLILEVYKTLSGVGKEPAQPGFPNKPADASRGVLVFW